jgi:hypothetical protein
MPEALKRFHFVSESIHLDRVHHAHGPQDLHDYLAASVERSLVASTPDFGHPATKKLLEKITAD